MSPIFRFSPIELHHLYQILRSDSVFFFLVLLYHLIWKMLCIIIIRFFTSYNHTSFSRDLSNREKWKFCRLCSGGVPANINFQLMDALWNGHFISWFLLCVLTWVYLSYSITVLYGCAWECTIELLLHKYREILLVGYSVATRPSDAWQCCIQLVIFPGICAILYIYWVINCNV